MDDSFDLELGCPLGYRAVRSSQQRGEKSCLLLNRPLHGWLRAARVEGGAEILDQHARAVLVDWDLEA